MNENTLLTGYTKEIFRPECNPSFTSVHCLATLNEDVACALPYLNTVLGGTHFLQDPTEVMFHHHGRIIKVGAREIAINSLADGEEADRILNWLVNEINGAWRERDSITPSYEGKKPPQLIEILKLLPKTNCKQCGQVTCMVFAAMLREGAKGPEACPELSPENLEQLQTYLSGYDLEA